MKFCILKVVFSSFMMPTGNLSEVLSVSVILASSFAQIETLTTLEDLKDSGFGRPSPRHGLKLLFWFMNKCVKFNKKKNLVIQCCPSKGDYGFHVFQNSEGLLPMANGQYFEVGNLNSARYPGALNLPDDVQECYRYTGNSLTCNKDRIIISLVGQKVVSMVYVTEHKSRGFDQERTYLLSRELIKLIQDSAMDLDSFLAQTGFYVDSLSLAQMDNGGIHSFDQSAWHDFTGADLSEISYSQPNDMLMSISSQTGYTDNSELTDMVTQFRPEINLLNNDSLSVIWHGRPHIETEYIGNDYFPHNNLPVGLPTRTYYPSIYSLSNDWQTRFRARDHIDIDADAKPSPKNWLMRAILVLACVIVPSIFFLKTTKCSPHYTMPAIDYRPQLPPPPPPSLLRSLSHRLLKDAQLKQLHKLLNPRIVKAVFSTLASVFFLSKVKNV